MLDMSQITPAPQETDHRPPPVMVRLHNPQLGVQILVSEEKAARYLAEGTSYCEGPLPATASDSKQQQSKQTTR